MQNQSSTYADAQLRRVTKVSRSKDSSPIKSLASKRPDDVPNQTYRSKVIDLIEGSRKAWGTRRSVTQSKVAESIRSIPAVDLDSLCVKRKYKTQSQEGKNTKWWFVIRGNETTLKLLDESWLQIEVQTTWKLEPLLRYNNPTESLDMEEATNQLLTQEVYKQEWRKFHEENNIIDAQNEESKSASNRSLQASTFLGQIQAINIHVTWRVQTLRV